MEVLRVYMWGAVIVFIFMVIGIKSFQNENYEKANNEDKEIILFARYKEPLLLLIVAVASLFWGIVLPILLTVALLSKKEVSDE